MDFGDLIPVAGKFAGVSFDALRDGNQASRQIG